MQEKLQLPLKVLGILSKISFKLSIPVFLLALSQPLFSEAITNYESFTEARLFNTTQNVVIDKKTIEENKNSSLTSLLARYAGFTSGSKIFNPQLLYLRGGEPAHILVVVDGVPVYDASSAARAFNFDSIGLDTINKIRILKGSHTVLFGGQAIAAVIEIHTIYGDNVFSNQENKVTSHFGLGLGSPSQSKVSLGTLYQKNNQAKDHALTQEKTEEPPSDQKASESGSDTNPQLNLTKKNQANWQVGLDAQFKNKKVLSPVKDSKKEYQNAQSKGGFSYLRKQENYKWNLQFNAFKEDSRYATISPSRAPQDTDQLDNFINQYSLATRYTYQHFLNPQIALGLTDSKKKIDDVDNSTFYDFSGQAYYSKIEIAPYKNDERSLVLGTNLIGEGGKFIESGRSASTKQAWQSIGSVYAHYGTQYTKGFNYHLGLRQEMPSLKNQDTSLAQLGIGYETGTKLELAQGVRYPSLSQKYFQYGNADLKTEKSTSISLQQEYTLSAAHRISLTLFQNDFKDLIGYNTSTRKYANTSKSQTQGVELSYLLSPELAPWTLQWLATYQEPKDLTTKSWLDKRPLYQYSFLYRHKFNQDLSTSAEYQNTGARNDMGTKLNAYDLIHLTLSYSWETYNLQARIDNLSDLKYQESAGFYSGGRSAFIELNYKF